MAILKFCVCRDFATFYSKKPHKASVFAFSWTEERNYIAHTVAEKALSILPTGFSDFWLKHAYLRRLGAPDDQANAIMFFAADDSAWVTGQLLSVSGGFGVGGSCFCDVYGG